MSFYFVYLPTQKTVWLQHNSTGNSNLISSQVFKTNLHTYIYNIYYQPTYNKEKYQQEKIKNNGSNEMLGCKPAKIK